MNKSCIKKESFYFKIVIIAFIFCEFASGFSHEQNHGQNWLNLLGIPCIAYAGEALEKNCSRLEVAEGLAPIINNDVHMARALAIDDARILAAETAGVKIDAETNYSMGVTVSDWSRIRANAYIVKYEIIAEEQRDGGYWVKIQAWIKCGSSETKVTRELLDRQRILFITEEGKTSQDKKAVSLVQSELEELLGNAGYRYFDSNYIKENVSRETWLQLQNRHLYDLNKEAFKFMADLVIYINASVGSARENEYIDGFSWYSGNAKVCLYRLSGENMGTPIINYREKTTQMLAQSHENLLEPGNGHPNAYMGSVAEPVAKKFMEKLSDHELFGTNDIEITVVAKNIPSNGEYHKFMTALKSQHGIVSGSLKELGRDHDEYRLSIKNRLKSIYLANLLAVDSRYTLTGHTWNTIELTFQQ